MAVSGCSRRRFLVTAGAVAAAPFIDPGRYRAFAGSVVEYSDRAVTLVNESLVMDMLSLFDMTRLFKSRQEGSNDNIRAILGGNFRRALGAIWQS